MLLLTERAVTLLHCLQLLIRQSLDACQLRLVCGGGGFVLLLQHQYLLAQRLTAATQVLHLRVRHPQLSRQPRSLPLPSFSRRFRPRRPGRQLPAANQQPNTPDHRQTPDNPQEPSHTPSLTNALRPSTPSRDSGQNTRRSPPAKSAPAPCPV